MSPSQEPSFQSQSTASTDGMPGSDAVVDCPASAAPDGQDISQDTLPPVFHLWPSLPTEIKRQIIILSLDCPTHFILPIRKRQDSGIDTDLETFKSLLKSGNSEFSNLVSDVFYKSRTFEVGYQGFHFDQRELADTTHFDLKSVHHLFASMHFDAPPLSRAESFEAFQNMMFCNWEFILNPDLASYENPRQEQQALDDLFWVRNSGKYPKEFGEMFPNANFLTINIHLKRAEYDKSRRKSCACERTVDVLTRNKKSIVIPFTPEKIVFNVHCKDCSKKTSNSQGSIMNEGDNTCRWAREVEDILSKAMKTTEQ